MGARRETTLRSQWLGRQLRSLREAAGLTLQEAGEYIQRDMATVSRMETGITPARVPDVLVLANLYGVHDDSRRHVLEELSRDVWRKGWWDDYKGQVSRGMQDLAWLESRAREIRSFDGLVLPGLMQTREYAEAVTRAAEVDASKEVIERWIDFRMARQRVLAKESPPRLSVVLDEALLHRTVGGPDVMAAQLEFLLELAELPCVQVRVLPYGAGAHAAHDGSYRILRMPEPYPDVAHFGTSAGPMYVEAEVDRYWRISEHLRQSALSPEQSTELISTVTKEMR